MGTAYWIFEYFRVLFAYLFLVFVYPSILFRSYLKGKSRIFWFGFCVTAMVMLVSTVVLGLGLLHILNAWVLRILFYGSLIWSISRSVHMPMTAHYLVYKVRNRTYGGRLLGVHIRDGILKFIGRGMTGLWKIIRRNFIEIAILAALLVYGILYFSWGPIFERGYGFSDIIVHHSWAYGLQQGKIFSAGIYPEAMHCLDYAISALFGIRLYNVILYLQCANMIAFLVSLYLFAREALGWKGSGVIVLAAFLTIKLDQITPIYIMSRLQTSLPQEFGLYTVFLIPAFLIRYLRNAGRANFRGKKTKFYWDENLIIFSLGIAASMSIHFYATIMAVYSCMGVVIIWFFKIFHWRRLVPLAVAATTALVLSFGPMMLAYAEGYNFQGSIYWALNIISPKEEDSAIDLSARAALEREWREDSVDPVVGAATEAPTEPEKEEEAQPITVRLQQMIQNVISRVQKSADGTYKGGYKGLYPQSWVDIYLMITKCAVGLFLGYRALMLLLKLVFRKKRFPTEIFDGYAMIVVITVIFMMAFAGSRSGIPTLISPDRVCAVAHAFLMCLLAIPVDLAGILLAAVLGTTVMEGVSALAVAAVFYAVISLGYYHSFLYVCGTRINAAVDVTESIISTIPSGQFTILSSTDELYQLIDYGFHEEVLTFLKKVDKMEYYIPTRYMFFFVEKHPIRYGHTHFPYGPAWLAGNDYAPKFGNSSIGRYFSGGEISDEKADTLLVLGSKPSNAYTNVVNREIVESRMARYLRELMKEYPNEINVYYEDDDFICYCLEQNPDRLINFGQRQA